MTGEASALTIANEVNCYCKNARQQHSAKHMKFKFSFTSQRALPPTLLLRPWAKTIRVRKTLWSRESHKKKYQ